MRARAAVVLAVGTSLGIAVVVVGGVWLAGGLRTQGKYLDWNFVSAMATGITALAAVVALGAISATLEQVRASRRAERLSLMPYLRVDVGFEEEFLVSSGFNPPKPRHMFSAEDFGHHIQVGSGKLPPSPEAGEPSQTLVLWVSNMQTAPAGNAYEIRIGLWVAWRAGDAWEVAQVSVRFAYVEAGKTTAIRLLSVAADIPEFAAVVFAVSYYGMFLDRELINRHGALQMYYDPRGGQANERGYGLEETS